MQSPNETLTYKTEKTRTSKYEVWYKYLDLHCKCDSTDTDHYHTVLTCTGAFVVSITNLASSRAALAFALASRFALNGRACGSATAAATLVMDGSRFSRETRVWHRCEMGAIGTMNATAAGMARTTHAAVNLVAPTMTAVNNATSASAWVLEVCPSGRRHHFGPGHQTHLLRDKTSKEKGKVY